MVHRSRYALLALSCLLLGACGSLPTPDPQTGPVSPPLMTASIHGSASATNDGENSNNDGLNSDNDTVLADHNGFFSKGAKWWAEGAKWWAEGAKWWAEGAKWWAEGAKWWAEGVFQPMPANSDVLRALKIDAAQAMAPHLGRGVTVAVIDTGIDLAHPMFRGALLPGHDFVDHNPDASEMGSDADAAYGHGTAVAGIIRQIAPEAKILPLRVLTPDGSGLAANVASAIRYAVDHGAQIVHLSIAARSANQGVRSALQYAVREGVMVVAACGNDGTNRCGAPAVSFAGNSPLARVGVSVSAANVDGTLPSWSTRGGEVLAPGVKVLSAYPEGRTISATGSSFAAPMVTGSLALALGEGKDPSELDALLTSGHMADASQLLR